MKKFMMKAGTMLASLALFIAVFAGGAASASGMYQPEEPARLKAFEK